MKNTKRVLWFVVICMLCAASVAQKHSIKKPSANAKSGASSDADSGTKVDLNTASEKEIEDLPGVGPATAKKIIAARPYSSVNDLSKAGLSAKKIEKITPMATVSGAASAPSAKASAASSTSSSSAAPAPIAPSSPARSNSSGAQTPAPETQSTSGAKSSSVVAQTRSQKGMVWVNLDTKVYHKEGTRWYGKTKNGKFMNESDAIAAGYRASKR